MRRLAMLAAAAAFPTLAHAGTVSWGDYRPTLAACIRHVQCESLDCVRATPCDQHALTWADRNWIDANVEAIHSLPQTPAELAKSRVSAQADGEIATEDHGTRLGVERYVFGPPAGDLARDPATAEGLGPRADAGDAQAGQGYGSQPTAWDEEVGAGDPGPLGATPRVVGPRDVAVPGRDPALPREALARERRHVEMPTVRVREGEANRRRDGIVVRAGNLPRNDEGRPTKG